MPRRLAGLAAKLARLRAAQDTLTGRQAAGGAAARIAAAQAAASAATRRLAAAEAVQAVQAAKMARYQAAVAAGKPWRYGKIPRPADQNKKVARVRQRAEGAAARLAAARAAAAAAPVKVSATDPDSRLVPPGTAAAGCRAGTCS